MSQGNLYIDGTWVQGRGDQWIKLNPVNQQPIWRGHAADSHDVEQAGLAARQAFVLWARQPLAERIAVVEAFASLLEQHKTHLAQVISQETSKPLWETLTEVQAMIGKVAISIGAYQQRTGETTTAFADGVAT